MLADMLQERFQAFRSLPSLLLQDTEAFANVNKYLDLSLALSTTDKYYHAWERFKSWLSKYNIFNPYQANDQMVAFYLAYLINYAETQSIGCSLIYVAVAAISHFFRSGGHSPPQSYFCQQLQKSAERILQPTPSRCEPISASELHRVLVKFLNNTCSLKIRMHLTVFLLMFVGLLRFDDAQKILVHRDLLQFITISDSNPNIDGMLIFIPCSKTDQVWTGAWVAVGATHGPFCPVRLIQELLYQGKYIRYHHSQDVGPLLRGVRWRGERFSLQEFTAPFSRPISPLSYTTFAESIQSLVKDATGKHVGLHSARKGGASHSRELSIDCRLVCGLGRWKQGTTYADTYIKMMDGNMRKYFGVTREIWKF